MVGSGVVDEGIIADSEQLIGWLLFIIGLD